MQVFELIQSLDKQERRYFSQTARAFKEDSAMSKLFEALCKMSVYEEDALLSKFPETAPTQLLALNNKLHSAILRAMRTYHSNGTVMAKLNAHLADVAFLFEKKLYRQCSKSLEKAERLASDNHLVTLELAVQDWKYKLFKKKTLEEADEPRVKAYSKRIDTLAQDISNEMEYKSFSVNFGFVTDTKYRHLNEAQRQVFYQNLQQNKLFRDEFYPRTFYARLHYYDINSTCSYYANDLEKSLYYETQLLWLLNESKGEELEKVMMHLEVLNNLMAITRAMHRYEDFFVYLSQAKDFITRYPKHAPMPVLKGQIEVEALVHEIAAWHDLGNMEKAAPLVQNLEDYFESGGDFGNKSLRSWAMLILASHYFLLKKFGEALEWNQRLLNSPNPRQTGYYHAARVQELMIHFELGNLIVLESCVKSLYRYLKKLESLTAFDRLLIRFIEDSAKIASRRELVRLFARFHEDLGGVNIEIDREFDGLYLRNWVAGKLVK